MSLIVITGSMFAGKTTTLMRFIEAAVVAGQSFAIVKPTIDTRSKDEIKTHAGATMAAHEIPRSPCGDWKKVAWLFDQEVVAFDEAQFLDPDWVPVIEQLAAKVEVFAVVLNLTAAGAPFGIAEQLLALADDIVHVKAVCMRCRKKDVATRTSRTTPHVGQVDIGGKEKYRSLCRPCWESEVHPAAVLKEAA